MINRIALMNSQSIQLHLKTAETEHPLKSNNNSHMVSPSLHSSPQENGPAFEMKFLLTEEQAQRVADDFRYILAPDPHGRNGADEGQYWVTTVYCDTPEFDMYHRQKGYAGQKFRLRRYGTENTVYLERKDKRGAKVKKRRTNAGMSELDRLSHPQTDLIWDGCWFVRQISDRRLSPVLTVMYQRQAFVGDCSEGPMRLTFDRCIRGLPTRNWQIEPFSGGQGILKDRVICEFKFRGSMPTPFKAVIESQQLSSASVSKYRLCLAATGLMPNESNVDA